MSKTYDLNPARLIPKLEVGNPIMLTITLSDKIQYQSVTVPHRLNKVKEMADKYIVPVLKKCMAAYKIVMEISEPLSSEGFKFYPRLHYHGVCVVRDPIKFLLHLGHLHALGYGYHITQIRDLDHKLYYDKYIAKQSSLWASSSGILPYQRSSKKATAKKSNGIKSTKMRACTILSDTSSNPLTVEDNS